MSANIAVLGGGVAGVVVANELARSGANVDLIERAPKLGGLHRSVTADGMAFDIGAFVFSEAHELIRTFPFLREHFPRVTAEMVSLTPTGRMDRYPMSLGGYYADFGVRGLGGTAIDVLTSKIRHRRRDSVPAFAQFYMGRKIYERSGLKNYIERLYGVTDDEVGIEFAKQRLAAIQDFTLLNIARRCVRMGWDRVARKPQPLSWTLVRPMQGFEYVYSMIQGHLEEQGVGLNLGCNVRSIRRTPYGFDVDLGGEVRAYDRVISTIPIPLAQRLAGIQCGMKCECMNLYSIFYSGRLAHPAAIQFNFTSTARWKRITAFSKYYGPHQDRDYWTVEVTSRDVSPAALQSMRAEFEQHARANGLIEGELQHHGEVVTERAYPIFQHGDAARLQIEREKLTAAGIDYVGRQGAFEYLASHDTATKARALAARVARERDLDRDAKAAGDAR
jgi:protoporphyrinogen oxidase